MCGCVLNQEDDPLSGDCGGDCWGCIGKIEADLEWDPSVEFVRKEIRDGFRDDDGVPKPLTDRRAAKRQATDDLDAIKQLLRDDWDPIEMMPHLPADEYDTYAVRVFFKLRAGESVEDVACYLGDVDMGGAPDPARDLRVARKAALIMGRAGVTD
ncbi:hypothetical protein [Caulobacter segnis]